MHSHTHSSDGVCVCVCVHLYALDFVSIFFFIRFSFEYGYSSVQTTISTADVPTCLCARRRRWKTQMLFAFSLLLFVVAAAPTSQLLRNRITTFIYFCLDADVNFNLIYLNYFYQFLVYPYKINPEHHNLYSRWKTDSLNWWVVKKFNTFFFFKSFLTKLLRKKPLRSNDLGLM